MKKTFLIISLIIICLLSGCKDSDQYSAPAGPTPTIPPGITKTKGVRYDTLMEGVVTKITKEKIFVSVEGKNWEFTLSDRAKEEMKIYDEKYNTPVVHGSYIQVKYEKLATGLIANNISFVTAN